MIEPLLTALSHRRDDVDEVLPGRFSDLRQSLRRYPSSQLGCVRMPVKLAR